MKKVFFLFIFLINLLIIFYFWYLRSGLLLTYNQAGLFIALGRIAGLLAVYFVLWQLVLIGRIKFLEQIFGLDRLAIVHHFNGLLAWAFIFLHPIFLIIGYGRANNLGFFSQIFDFLFRWDDLFLAFLSAGVFLIIIILSMATIRRRLKYEIWYFIHLFTYLAIIWAFGHQLELGYDLQNIIFAGYWSALYFVVVALLVYYRFLTPLYLFYYHRFYVDRIESENDQVVSIYIKGRNLNKFNFRAGQFAIFRFLSGELALQAHPFSFSVAPNGEYLRISVKNLGDFTASLKNNLRVNSLVIIDGPHGIFTTQRSKNNKLTLIAGGIGITPLRAIIEKEPTKDLTLFYSGSKEADLIFRSEIDALQNDKLRVNYIVNGGDNWSGEKGHLDEEKLKRLLPDYLKQDFYLCGPPIMIKNIRRIFKKIGVRKNKIYFEKFSLN